MTQAAAPEAPDFNRNYPSAGKTIGPAWRAMWARLLDDEWHEAKGLATHGAEVAGCAFGTARTLLYAAAQHGHITSESRFDETSRRWRTWYRRAA